MGEELEDIAIIADAIEKAEVTKERLKTDPDAVRKILAGTVSVTEDVTVYPNKVVNKAYSEFNDRVINLGLRVARENGETDKAYAERTAGFKAEYEAAVLEFEALKVQLQESAVTFHMVSLGKKAVKNIRNAARKKFPLPDNGIEDVEVTEARDEYYQASLIAAHLVQDGYTVEDVQKIIDEWPTKAFAQLWVTTQKLSITDDYLGNLPSDF